MTDCLAFPLDRPGGFGEIQVMQWRNAMTRLIFALAVLGILLPACPVRAADEGPAVADVKDFAALPANTWTLIGRDDNGGAKAFARLIWAEQVGRLYLWGVGGPMVDRSQYKPYELESFAVPADGAGWAAALPESKKDAWADGKWTPFRIHGQMGTDGPRMRLVGSGQPNVVTFFETDGIARPSPVLTFNQACYDSTRRRIVYFAGGRTFALDPASNTWTDLKPATNPTACDALAGASQCYDPVNDEMLLFGGGLAFNLEGAARTWLYDCKKNEWQRPRDIGPEPPPRCTSPIVYDPATQSMVMFGGYDQAAALNDTWVYHCADRRWEKRTPNPSPPPMFDPAAAVLPGGRVVVCGPNAMVGTRTHGATWDNKETWVYDVAKDAWTPLANTAMPGTRWLTAAGSTRHGVAFLMATGRDRRTYALRYDAAAAMLPDAAGRPGQAPKGAPPGAKWFKYHDQKESLENAPKPDIEAHEKFLADLPVNQFVDAKPPGLLIAKTWSGATIDTDRGVVVYTGGGHSGYSGNDVANYDVAANRWTQDAPPRFPPYLESTNSAVYGYSYDARPWSQHTYLWYGYDPTVKKVVYCARQGINDGSQVLLGDDPSKAFIYRQAEHGQWIWVYDPVTRKLSAPCFGRPFGNPWSLSLLGTPKGLFASAGDTLYKAAVAGEKVTWTELPGKMPAAKKKGYNYEWMPLAHDSKRDRLIHLMGDNESVEVHARPIGGDAWAEVATTGPAAIGREAMYLPKQDVLLLLARDRLFALDLASNTWRELDVAMPKGAYGTEAAMVYDPVHDVSVLLLPSGFSGALQTMLFRYDPKTAKYKSAASQP